MSAWNPGVEYVFWTSEFKIVYQNSMLSTIGTFNMIKGVIDITLEEKYQELRKKSVNRKNNRYLFTYLENRPKSRPYIALFKEEISHKMCWIYHETLPIRLPIHCPLKNNAWEPRNDDWFCPTPSAVLKIFYHWGDVLICLLINTSAPSHWLKSVAWPVGPVLKFRDITDWLRSTHQTGLLPMYRSS